MPEFLGNGTSTCNSMANTIGYPSVSTIFMVSGYTGSPTLWWNEDRFLASVSRVFPKNWSRLSQIFLKYWKNPVRSFFSFSHVSTI